MEISVPEEKVGDNGGFEECGEGEGEGRAKGCGAKAPHGRVGVEGWVVVEEGSGSGEVGEWGRIKRNYLKTKKYLLTGCKSPQLTKLSCKHSIIHKDEQNR